MATIAFRRTSFKQAAPARRARVVRVMAVQQQASKPTAFIAAAAAAVLLVSWCICLNTTRKAAQQP